MAACGARFSLPVVVVLGATGTGKSKLALQLAARFQGEVISSDSMQVYKGLDVITNKVTPEERKQVKHHLLDFLEPQANYTVVDFRDKALPIVEDLLSKQKLPVVVGGTNYYIESLLWDVLVGKRKRKNSGDHGSDDDVPGSFMADCSTQDMYRKLQKVDPESADELHPNNRRKIARALEVLEREGRTLSSILREQRSKEGGSSLGGPLRFPNCLILWLQSQQAILDTRLDQRVDQMMDQGLLEELDNFHKLHNQQRIQQNQTPDYTHGIFQSIGFKEFHDYLLLPDDQRESEDGQKRLMDCVEQLKRATRAYSRRQVKWIRNRFLRQPGRPVPPVYALDATEPADWDQKVLEPSVEVVQAALKGRKPAVDPLAQEERTIGSLRGVRRCETCDQFLVGDDQWRVHVGSRKHHKRMKKRQSGAVTMTDVESSTSVAN